METASKPQLRISPDWARDWAARFLAGWNSHDPEQLLSLATDDVTWVDPFIPGGVAQGKPAVSEWLVASWVAFPDLTFEIVGEPFVSLDGTRVAAAWRGTATFTGRLEAAGIDPTGARVEMTGTDVYEFAAGLVRRVVTETDTMSFLIQIGAVPARDSSH
jgi:predicted ester cyclase